MNSEEWNIIDDFIIYIENEIKKNVEKKQENF